MTVCQQTDLFRGQNPHLPQGQIAQDDPAPPHYELGRTDDYDFLNVKFEPPAIKTGDYYNDAFFSRYDTGAVENDADAVFSGLKETEE